MTARVISLDAWRYGRQIVERVPVSDVRVEFARRVEHAFGSDVELIDKWAATKSCLHGSYDVPSDTEMF